MKDIALISIINNIFASMSKVVQIALKQNIVDESLASNEYSNLTLFCCLDHTKFSFGLLDNDRSKVVLLKEYHQLNGKSNFINEDFLIEVIESDDDLKKYKKQKTIFSIFPTCSTLIPTPFFQKEESNKILATVCAISPSDVIYDDHIFEMNANHVYPINQNLLNKINHNFSQVNIFHAATAFIESQLRINKLSDEILIAINIRNEKFDMIIGEGSKLLMYNTFDYETSEDLIYYILFTCEQLHLNPDAIKVIFYGDIHKTDASWNVAKKYIRNADLGYWPEGLDFSYGFDRLNPHQHFVLLSQFLCA